MGEKTEPFLASQLRPLAGAIEFERCWHQHADADYLFFGAAYGLALTRRFNRLIFVSLSVFPLRRCWRSPVMLIVIGSSGRSSFGPSSFAGTLSRRRKALRRPVARRSDRKIRRGMRVSPSK